jgi:hypothetical protein
MTLRSELEVRLEDWASSQDPAIPIAWEGVSFVRPEGVEETTAYLQPFLMPALTVNPTVDGTRSRLTGIFQINIWTRENFGSAYGEEIAESLINLYPVVPKTGTVSIEQTPSVTQALYDAGWRIVPLTIRYRQEK